MECIPAASGKLWLHACIYKKWEAAMSDVERRTSDKEELPEKAKGGGGAQPPKEIKTCEVTERRTQTWVAFTVLWVSVQCAARKRR
jgi:hypothetical protein